MRKKLARYLMLETRKDGTKFTSKGLKEAAERLQGISRSYDQRQHALVEQVNSRLLMCSAHLGAVIILASHASPPACLCEDPFAKRFRTKSGNILSLCYFCHKHSKDLAHQALRGRRETDRCLSISNHSCDS